MARGAAVLPAAIFTTIYLGFVWTLRTAVRCCGVLTGPGWCLTMYLLGALALTAGSAGQRCHHPPQMNGCAMERSWVWFRSLHLHSALPDGVVRDHT